MNISFTTKYNFADYFEMHSLNFKKIKPWLYIIVIPYLIINIIELLVFSIGIFDPLSCISIFLSILLISPLLPMTTAFFVYSKSKQTLKSVTFEFDTKGVTIVTSTDNLKSTWGSYYKYLYNDKIINLYRSSLIITALPRRSFKSDNDWNNLLKLLKENIKQK